MKRLKYVSRFARRMAPDEVHELVAHAQKRNAELQVTGVLVTTGFLFYQVIEGPEQAVQGLYERILADSRHVDVLLLGVEENIAERFFPDWSMQAIDISSEAGDRLEPLRELLAVIVESRKRIERLELTLERAIWRELAG